MKRLGILLFGVSVGFSSACGDDGGGAADAAANIDSAPPAPDAAVDAMPSPDAMPANLACVGDPLPTTVDAPPITVSGTVLEVTNAFTGETEPLAGASVTARLIADDSVLDTTSSGDPSGTYTLTDPDDSTTPIEAYLEVTATDMVDTYVYPPTAIYENLANDIIMIPSSIWGLIPTIAGVDQDAANGALLVAVTDCDGNAIQGATISVTPSTGVEILYANDSGVPSSTPTSTGTTGLAYVFNVPPGDVIVDAEKGGVSLREHGVQSFAGASTTTAVVP